MKISNNYTKYIFKYLFLDQLKKQIETMHSNYSQ